MRSPRWILHVACCSATTSLPVVPNTLPTSIASATRSLGIYDFSVLDAYDAIRVFGDRVTMRNDEDCSTVLSMILEEREDLLLRLGVDFTGRLIGDKYGRLGGERHRRPRARCFATRTLGWI